MTQVIIGYWAAWRALGSDGGIVYPKKRMKDKENFRNMVMRNQMVPDMSGIRVHCGTCEEDYDVTQSCVFDKDDFLPHFHGREEIVIKEGNNQRTITKEEIEEHHKIFRGGTTSMIEEGISPHRMLG